MPARPARSLRAEANFRASVAAAGGVPRYDDWRGSNEPHAVRCAAGHDAFPRPRNVQQGQGICGDCVRRSSQAAHDDFVAALARLGAVLNGPWAGVNAPHDVTCSAGHACTPEPRNVLRGQGICKTCAGNDRDAAEAEFRSLLARDGVELLEDGYLGAGAKHLVRCPAGHERPVRPAHVRRRARVCPACERRDSEQARVDFIAALAERGAVMVDESAWHGVNVAHEIRCAAGHVSFPQPRNVLAGQGVCADCVRRSSATAEADFRAVLAGRGAALEEPWRGTDFPHRVRCAAGHVVWPRPTNVLRGSGICRDCRAPADVVYVVQHPRTGVVKVGITGGDPRWRLAAHAADGFTRAVRTVRAPDAVDVERVVLGAMVDAGMPAVRGREYFAAGALATILDVVDGWTAAA